MTTAMESMGMGAVVGGTKGWKGDSDSEGGVQDVSGVSSSVAGREREDVMVRFIHGDY